MDSHQFFLRESVRMAITYYHIALIAVAAECAEVPVNVVIGHGLQDKEPYLTTQPFDDKSSSE